MGLYVTAFAVDTCCYFIIPSSFSVVGRNFLSSHNTTYWVSALVQIRFYFQLFDGAIELEIFCSVDIRFSIIGRRFRDIGFYREVRLEQLGVGPLKLDVLMLDEVRLIFC